MYIFQFFSQYLYKILILYYNMNINLDISPIKILMILYLLMLSHGSLIKHNNLLYMIENNNIIKHVTIFTAIAVIISLIYNGLPMLELLFYSLIIYIVYILSIKLDKKYVLIFGLLLIVMYFVDYYNRHKIQIIKNDKNINLKNKDKDIELLQRKNILIMALFAVLIVGGSLKYDDKKNIQYGNGYTISKFLDI
jgi:hypothetical protein